MPDAQDARARPARGPRLEGKVAIVTGAGSKSSGLGTGKAIAVRFAQEGARVVLVDRHEDRLAETRAWIEEEGGKAATVVAELADPTANQRIVDEAIAQFGRVDILVSNAAAYPDQRFLDTTIDELQRVVGVNLIAPFMLSQAVIPGMIEAGGGSIIYITSILAMRGGGPAPYAASKAGLMGLTTSLANTFGVNGIRVNCVAPGNVDTPMRSGLLARAGFDLTQVDATKATSLGIQGDAWDIADAALYLASDAGRYITGLLLPVDGGTTTKLP